MEMRVSATIAEKQIPCIWIYLAILLQDAHGYSKFSLPSILEKASDIVNSTECALSFLELANASRNGENWALNMLDATAKLPSGVIRGNVILLGDYDECLAVTHPNNQFIGQYCLVQATPKMDERSQVLLAETGNKFALTSFGVCMPSTCSGPLLIEKLNELKLGPHNLSEALQFGFYTPEACHTREFWPDLIPLDYVMIALFIIIGLLLASSTIYDYHQRFTLKREPSNKLLVSFSVYTNGKALLGENKASQFGSLDGIKGLSMLAVIVGHASMQFLLGNSWNRIEMMDHVDRAAYVPLNNAHNVTDTFFVLGSMLLVLGFFRDIKTKGSWDFPLALIKRYLRLTPSYAILLLFTLTLRRYLAIGPQYSGAFQVNQNMCWDNWPKVLLYVHNYWYDTISNRCLGQGWYVEADMQMFLFCPLFLYPALKWPKITAGFALFATLAAASLEFYIANIWDLGPAVTYARTAKHLIKDHYVTHTRVAPYFFGFFWGFIYVNIIAQGEKFKMSKRTVIVGWIIGGGSFFLAQMPLYFTGYGYTQPAAAIILAYRRILWSGGVAWIVIACTTGYGGFSNTLLNWRPIVFLGKISYNVYLLHLVVIENMQSTSRDMNFAGLNEVATAFLNYAAWTVVAAFGVTLCIEIPCHRVFSCLLRDAKVFPFPRPKKSFKL